MYTTCEKLVLDRVTNEARVKRNGTIQQGWQVVNNPVGQSKPLKKSGRQFSRGNESIDVDKASAKMIDRIQSDAGFKVRVYENRVSELRVGEICAGEVGRNEIAPDKHSFAEFGSLE